MSNYRSHTTADSGFFSAEPTPGGKLLLVVGMACHMMTPEEARAIAALILAAADECKAPPRSEGRLTMRAGCQGCLGYGYRHGNSGIPCEQCGGSGYAT